MKPFVFDKATDLNFLFILIYITHSNACCYRTAGHDGKAKRCEKQRPKPNSTIYFAVEQNSLLVLMKECALFKFHLSIHVPDMSAS